MTTPSSTHSPMEEPSTQQTPPEKESLHSPDPRFRFRDRRTRVILFIVTLLALAFIIRYLLFLTLPPGDGARKRIIEVARGETLSQVAALLEREGLVSSARLFVFHGRLKGEADRIKAGEYLFSDGMRPSEILRKMVNGEVHVRRFSVPEGYSIYQLAELMEGQKIFTREGFLKAARDPSLLAELGIQGRSVEGYLFPSTYEVPRRMDEAALIRTMVGRFRKVYGERFEETARRRGMRLHEVVTLASIIEKEAVVPEERPLISSVFHNRLARGMRLQSDPTAVYGVRAFPGTVTKRDIELPTPYNTYLVDGLPPGPIGNPSEGAIEAALNPAVTNYLYFVARKDGTHHFSTNLQEHNEAVRKYLK